MVCTVLATAPTQRSTAYIRWIKDNRIVAGSRIEVPPTTVDGTHSVNYSHPLTIRYISLSDAGRYRCRASVRNTRVPNVIASDIITRDTIINIKCKSCCCLVSL